MTTAAESRNDRRQRGVLRALGHVLGRSLFPFAALTIIAGTVLWGPWGTLVLAIAWWNIVTRVA
jgi:hypothetical protein